MGRRVARTLGATVRLHRAAHEEWRHRWDHDGDRVHGCWTVVLSIGRESFDSLDWPSEEPTDPPQITGDWEAADYVDAYRLDYANEKRHRFEWSKDRSAPPWLEEYTVATAGDV